MAKKLNLLPIQLALHMPGTDDDLDEALGYDLDSWHQHFVSEIIRGTNGVEAVKAADAITGHAPRTYAGCGDRSYRLLNGRTPHSAKISTAIKNRKIRLAANAKLTEDEWWAALRYTRDVALGVAKVRKTLLHQGDGPTLLETVEVYEPSLTAATKTLELAGRNLNLLGADATTIEPGADGAVTVRFVGIQPGDEESQEGDTPSVGVSL